MKQLLFGIFLLALCGCHELPDHPPADLIPQDKMIKIQADIHIADALVEHRVGTQTVDRPMTMALYTQIYKNYGITAGEYKTSYQYYVAHPEIMKVMYGEIITEISKKEAQLNRK